MDTNTLEAILLIVLGGLFGWILGHLPDKYVYAVMAVTVILAILVIQ